MSARGRSCLTCDNAEVAFADDGEPIVECHLHPPMTMPEVVVTEDLDDGRVTDAHIDITDGHRYPRVRSDDWCSAWVDQEHPSTST